MSKNDPSVICRGKNLHLPSLKHFIAAIPKTAMPKAQFFAYAEQRMKGFQKTHSQIARQLGLYYCDAQGICHPRFTEDVSFDAIFKYGQYWAHHYFVPNPFTKSFPQNCSPTCIYGYFLAHAKALGYDVNAIFGEMFGIDMADLDKAKSYLFKRLRA